MLKWITSILVQSLILGFICSETRFALAQVNSPINQAVWVWPSSTDGTPISDVNARHTLVLNAATSGVTALFVSVYQKTANASGRYMFSDQVLSDLIQQAHNEKMQVWAEYGNSDWPNYACDDSSFPVQRMSEVLGYNKANPTAQLDGVVLDVEPLEINPGQGPSRTDLIRLLSLYSCILHRVQPSLPVSAAINAFWTTYIGFKPHHMKPFYVWVINLPLKYVVVMGYRNFVGASDCSSKGIACLDKAAIAYADSCFSNPTGGCDHDRRGSILAGLETGNISDPGANVTFYNQGQIALNQTAIDMVSLFPNGGLGGFAVEAYQSAYLGSGSVNWPSTNPNFPKSKALNAHSHRAPK
jgi:hypothetical protein